MSPATTARKPYSIQDVPERGDGLSRFMLTVTPAGQGAKPEATMEGIFGKLSTERIKACEPIAPDPVTVKLSYATADHVAPRGSVTARPSFLSTRPARIWRKLSNDPGGCLDSFFLGGEAWENAPDVELYAALSDLLRATGVRDGEVTRRCNDWLCRAILARAGIKPPDYRGELPAPGTPHEG